MVLNRNEKKILKLLEDNPYISQKDLADKMKISRPSVANLISNLQNKGLILGKPYVLSKEKYITCVGGANIDYTFKLEEDLVLGTSNPIKSSTSFGGVIRNVAENLSRLDCKLSLMTVVGDDSHGEELLQASKKLMETFASEKIKNKTTGGYYSIIDTSGNMSVGYADMSVNSYMDRSWVLNHKQHLSMSSWIISDLNVSKDAVETLLEFSKSENIPFAVIGVSGPKMKNLPRDIDGLDLIICNKDETQTYFETDIKNNEELCKMWLKSGVKRAVLTDGINGSYYGENNAVKHQKAYLVNIEDVVDVTGAGDSFSSAVIYGLTTKHNFEDSVRMASVSSSLTIQEPFAVNQKLSINLIKRELIKNENI